jgi:regulator of sigma E protease
MSWVITVVVFVIMVSVLVAAHEYGHFLFARLLGMEVEEFSIGMGNPAFTWMAKKGTKYNLRPIPIGGFVKIKGMMPQEDGGEVHIKNGFYSKSAFARLLTLFAGPLFSVVAGVILLTLVFSVGGEPTKKAIMGPLISPGPAQSAGILPGDLVVAMNGKPVNTFVDMRQYISTRAGQKIDVELVRNGQTLHKTVVPVLSNVPILVLDSQGEPTGKTALQAMIGVEHSERLDPTSLSTALGDAIKAPILTAAGLFDTFTHPKTITDNLGGPGTIIVATKDASDQGLYHVLFLAGLLSISLGFMNLLPVMPFDGGQMVIAFAEMLRRRRLSIQVQGWFASVGYAFVGVLILCVVFADVKHIRAPEAPDVKFATKPADQTTAPARVPSPSKKPVTEAGAP